jgi:hypothetical protein
VSVRFFAWSVFFVAACVADNPYYSPSTEMDLAGVAPMDLSSAAPGDLSMSSPMCTDGKRACSGSKAESVVCESGMFVADRMCPTGSTCADGVCGLPASGPNNSGRSCMSVIGGATATLCFQGAMMPVPDCQPFVQMGSIVWECAPPVGNGGVGVSCTKGAECRSGFCGSNGTCYRACVFATDCPNSGGKWVCSPVQISVEGVQTTANSCVAG